MYSDKATDKNCKIIANYTQNSEQQINEIQSNYLCLDFFLMLSFLKNKIGKALLFSKH